MPPARPLLARLKRRLRTFVLRRRRPAPDRPARAVQAGLIAASTITAVFYAILAQRAPLEIFHYTIYEPLGWRMFIYDMITLLYLGYLLGVAARLRKIKRPWLPWAISCVHVFLLPYAIMGDNAIFLRFKRYVAFHAGFPLAVACLTFWLALTTVRRRRAALAGGAEKG
jgi:hypothetical protein